MDERAQRNLLNRLRQMERRSTRLRFGRVSDLDPLSVKLGGSRDTPFTDVGTLSSNLAQDNHVAVLMSGNDLLILDKVGGSSGNGGGGGTGPPGPAGAVGPAGPVGATGATGPSGIVDAAELTVMSGSFQSADYTLAAITAGKMVRMASNTTPLVLTVPPQSSVPFPLWTTIGVARYGTQTVTVDAGAGVTIRSPGDLLDLASQYSQGSLWLMSLTGPGGQGEWLLGGDLA